MKTPLLTALALLALAGTLGAQNVATKHVSGEQVEARTRAVMTKIAWSQDLEQLKARAQEENKLIFWMQIVGELDGGL